jgi:hypothetical protein
VLSLWWLMGRHEETPVDRIIQYWCLLVSDLVTGACLDANCLHGLLYSMCDVLVIVAQTL